jgi:hypothetical protein
MTVHRFTVNIPNGEARGVTVRLRLQRVTAKSVAALGLGLPESALEVESAGITLDPCADEGKPELVLKVQAYSSRDVNVVIATAAAGPKRGGVTAFNLIDERGGKVAGGVMLACVDRVGPEPAGQVIKPPRPCPVVLAGDPYPLAAHGDPSKPPAAKILTGGTAVELVVPITNPRSSTLSEVQVYLEHLGVSDATFAPATWNVGDFAPGAVFYATWPVSTAGRSRGTFTTSVVVASARADPVRLEATLRIGTRSDSPQKEKTTRARVAARTRPVRRSPAGRRRLGRG